MLGLFSPILLTIVRAEKSFIFHNTPGNYARPHLLKVESCVDKLVTYRFVNLYSLS